MAVSFNLYIGDMTVGVAAPERSAVGDLGYGKIAANLRPKLARIIRLIPNVFSSAWPLFQPGSIAPTLGDLDALVLIDPGPHHTNLTKESKQKATADVDIFGMTELGGPAVTAVVFLNRFAKPPAGIEQLANAILHELGHAKSGEDEKMHDENPNGILAKKGATLGRAFTDSDAKWLSKHLSKQVSFETKHFGGLGQLKR